MVDDEVDGRRQLGHFVNLLISLYQDEHFIEHKVVIDDSAVELLGSEISFVHFSEAKIEDMGAQAPVSEALIGLLLSVRQKRRAAANRSLIVL